MKIHRIVAFFLLFVTLWSCRDDDEDFLNGAVVVPPRLLSEVAVENDIELQAFLKSHFYNYEEFAAPPADFDFKIKIDTIAGDNADKRAMFDDITSEVISILPSSFGISDQEDSVDHTLYFLEARKGAGEKPTIGDNAILRYEGSLLDGTLFDASSTPIRFYLPQLIRGFGAAMTKVNSGSEIVDNGDGTVDFGEFGVGIVFIPSGLAYGNGRGPSGALPSYANLIFRLEGLAFEKNSDFDGDGIPSFLEDLDGDGNLNNDNTDADLEQIFLPNHGDIDDDNDGILTIDEIELDADGNFVAFKDTDGDGISDHLDNDN